jgi:hypothetical protein
MRVAQPSLAATADAIELQHISMSIMLQKYDFFNN